MLLQKKQGNMLDRIGAMVNVKHQPKTRKTLDQAAGDGGSSGCESPSRWRGRLAQSPLSDSLKRGTSQCTETSEGSGSSSLQSELLRFFGFNM